MAEEEKAVIVIQTIYENKGELEAKKGMDAVAKKAEKVGQATVTAGKEGSNSFNVLQSGVARFAGALAAAKGVIDFFASSIAEYQEHARSVSMLAAAFQNVGYTASGAMAQAKAFADEMEASTGLAGETFLNAQRTLANYKVVGVEAQEAIRAAFALSSNQGMNFENALMLIARAAAGSTSALSRYGITLDENIKEGDKFAAVVGKINDQFGASAQATMGDMTSKVGVLKETWGGFKELVGEGLSQGLTPVLGWLTTLFEWLQKGFVILSNGWGLTFDLINIGAKSVEVAVNGIILGFRKAITAAAELGNKMKLVSDEQVAAAQVAEERAAREVESGVRQISTLNRMKTEIFDLSKLENKVSEEQQAGLEAQAAKINALRGAQEQELEVTKEKTDELKRQQEILDNMGLSSSEDLKGWNRNASESEEGPTPLETFAGGASQLATAENAVMQYKAEAERLEELRALKQQYIDQEITDETLKQEALRNLEQQYNTQRLANDKKSAQARQQVYGSMWSALTGLASSENKKVAAVGKVASIAQATMSMFTGAAKALELPFPANLAAVATVLAQGAALVSQIEAVKLAKGGLVKAVTGGVPAVIGEGGSDEAVLPLDNSRAMRRIGGAIAEESGPAGLAGAITVNVNVTANGGLPAFLNELTEATQNGVTEALRYANVAVKAGNEQSGYSV